MVAYRHGWARLERQEKGGNWICYLDVGGMGCVQLLIVLKRLIKFYAVVVHTCPTGTKKGRLKCEGLLNVIFMFYK